MRSRASSIVLVVVLVSLDVAGKKRDHIQKAANEEPTRSVISVNYKKIENEDDDENDLENRA
jgi:hypothetical protein